MIRLVLLCNFYRSFYNNEHIIWSFPNTYVCHSCMARLKVRLDEDNINNNEGEAQLLRRYLGLILFRESRITSQFDARMTEF